MMHSGPGPFFEDTCDPNHLTVIHTLTLMAQSLQLHAQHVSVAGSQSHNPRIFDIESQTIHHASGMCHFFAQGS
eukprot:1390974-Amphidinium_carterae.1